MARTSRSRSRSRKVGRRSARRSARRSTKRSIRRSAKGALPAPMMGGANRKSPKKARSWVDSVSQARRELNVTGFVAIKKGSPLYKRSKEIHEGSK
jgi:hypothetical protein